MGLLEERAKLCQGGRGGRDQAGNDNRNYDLVMSRGAADVFLIIRAEYARVKGSLWRANASNSTSDDKTCRF